MSPCEPWLCGQREAHIAPAIELRTAVLCALTTACYDNQVRELGLSPSELWLPEDEFAMTDAEPDGARLVRQEGSIYLPKWVLRDRAGRDIATPSRAPATDG